jgi:hypothetical protein
MVAAALSHVAVWAAPVPMMPREAYPQIISHRGKDKWQRSSSMHACIRSLTHSPAHSQSLKQ